MLRRLAVVASLAACGSEPATLEIAPPGDGTPALIAYRDGTGPWITPARDAAGRYELVVHDDYELWRICTGPGGVLVVEGVRATVADPVPILQRADGTDCVRPAAAPATALVSGILLQAGTVSITGVPQTSTSPSGWRFVLGAELGHRELIASDYDRFATFVATRIVRFGLDVGVGDEVGNIDLAAALPVGARSATVTGVAADADVFGDVTLATALGNTTTLAGLEGGSHTLGIPMFAQSPGDVVTSSFTARRDDVEQTARLHEPSVAESVELLAPAPAELDRTGTVTWRAIDDRLHYVEVIVTATPCPGCVVQHRVAASRGWLEHHGDHALSLVSEVPPGFDPAWGLDLAQATTAAFAIRAAIDGIEYETSTALALPSPN